MPTPIPVQSKPVEPRWWVSTNSQVEGPYGQAYILACLTAGQLSVQSLLCLEGEQQWQPMSRWPQFQAAIDQMPPQVRINTSSSSAGPAVVTSQRIASKATKEITYAKLISPGLLLFTGFFLVLGSLSGAENLEETLFVMFFLAIEAAARGYMFLGAGQLESGISAGLASMKIGSWVLTGVHICRMLFVMLLVLVAAAALFNEPMPEQQFVPGPAGAPAPSSDSTITQFGVCFAVLLQAGELGYTFLFRSALARLERQR